ncbi:MAG: amidohydrolase [Planctomycetes bacterium]|nr:amidohydrolase [Planctomycetota bacterium]
MSRSPLARATLAALCLLPVLRSQDAFATWFNTERADLLALYQHLHAHPELSFHETATAARIADELERLGIQVTRKVGGHGVVGVLQNGDGRVGMLRCDLDALPIAEATGLPFASPHEGKAADGSPVGKMHACGHDLHMTNLVGTARWFAAHKDLWRGTLVLVAQPAEERAGGAKAMLADGLLTRFPRPAWAVAVHTAAELPADQIGIRPGFAMANVDSCDITLTGRGGHGASPHLTIDPIVMAARLVLDLQTIVGREIDPVEPAVVTVGAIAGGSKHNIIDDHCRLQITLRSYSPTVREQLKAAVVRKAKATAASAGASEPIVEFSEPTVALRNDEPLAAKVAAAARAELGNDAVIEIPPTMGAEDFGQIGTAGIPICMFRLGTVARDRLATHLRRGDLPPLHSARYYPDVEQALPTGVRATVAIVRSLLRE